MNYTNVPGVNDIDVIAISETIQIPMSELEFAFSPSRGPGGQHANRAHTRATLLFDIANSPSLDQPTREKLLQSLASRLDKRGILRITAQGSRSQHRNRQFAITRFVTLLNDALYERPKRIPTKPSAAATRKRVDEKKKLSRRKQERRRDWSEDT